MSKARIWLADDHAVVRAGLRNALQELSDLEIVGEVGDGPSLRTALDQAKPDCLLIDVSMPDFEPVVAIRQIRAQHPDIKILVVSAYDDDEYVQGMLGAGVDGYHLKDQPLSDLHLAVQRVLEGKRWISIPLIEKLLTIGEPCDPQFKTSLVAAFWSKPRSPTPASPSRMTSGSVPCYWIASRVRGLSGREVKDEARVFRVFVWFCTHIRNHERPATGDNRRSFVSIPDSRRRHRVRH